jgi:hypothetical protein
VAGRTGNVVLTSADVTDLPPLGSLATASDAPHDGAQYARSNSSWQAIQTGNPFDQSLNTYNSPVFDSVHLNLNEFSSSYSGDPNYDSTVSLTTDGKGGLLVDNHLITDYVSTPACSINSDGTFYSKAYIEDPNTPPVPAFVGWNYTGTIYWNGEAVGNWNALGGSAPDWALDPTYNYYTWQHGTGLGIANSPAGATLWCYAGAQIGSTYFDLKWIFFFYYYSDKFYLFLLKKNKKERFADQL